MKRGLVILLLVLGLACPALGWKAHVKSVHDGDSINVRGPENQVVNIRLYGIDAPESKQPFGYQAKRRLSKLVARKAVQIEPQDTDRYGRTVALVRLDDGTLVNEVLVAEGFVWVYEQYCRLDLCQNLRALEQRARQERRGLWAENDPQRPSDWRKEHKTEEWYKAPVRAVKSLARKIKVVLR